MEKEGDGEKEEGRKITWMCVWRGEGVSVEQKPSNQ